MHLKRCIPPLVAALTLAGTPLLAQQPAAPPAQRTIRVSGTGEARAQPDQARVSFAVETSAPTAKGAGEQNARAMTGVLQALTGAGVPREDLETSNYTLYPDYSRPQPGQEPEIRGYRAVNSVSFETGELARVGPLIDVALGAGANRLSGVSFSLRDSDAVQAEALRHAVARARAAAEAMAAALGVALGPIVDASTDAAPPDFPRPIMRAEAMDAAAPPTPIEPGEQTFNATVQLVYAISGS